MGTESRRNPFAKDTTIDLPVGIRDAFGRRLGEGDKIVLDLAQQIVLTIQSVAPVVDPSAPPNLMDVTLACKFRSVRNEPIREFIRIIAATEIAPPLGLVGGGDTDHD